MARHDVRRADGGRAEEIRELEITEDRGQDIGRQLGPVGGVGGQRRLHGDDSGWRRRPVEQGIEPLWAEDLSDFCKSDNESDIEKNSRCACH